MFGRFNPHGAPDGGLGSAGEPHGVPRGEGRVERAEKSDDIMEGRRGRNEMEGERDEGGGLSVVPEERDGARRGGEEGEGAEEKAFGAELLDEGEGIPSERVAGREKKGE